jgi:hypothetical protein
VHKDYHAHFFQDLKFTLMLHTHSDAVCAMMVWFLIKFFVLLTGCSWWQINKQGTVASSFAKSELIYGFYLSGIYGLECVVIILTAGDLKGSIHNIVIQCHQQNFDVLWIVCLLHVSCLWAIGNHLQHLVWIWWLKLIIKCSALD